MKENYKIVFTKEFVKAIKRLDRQTGLRILGELRILEDNPFAGKQLVGRLSELKSFRVGDYRVIYQVSERTIIVRAIGHRKKVYDR